MIKPWQEHRDVHEHISGPINSTVRHELMQAEIDALRKENKTLRDALELAVRQNDCDMVMTGDELRKCYAALGETK